MTTRTLAALRVDPDGTWSDLALDPHLHDALSDQLGGPAEYVHYGQRGGPVVCAVVHETGAVGGMPANEPASAAVEAVRGGPLSYLLHGPVVFVGYMPRDGATASLPEDVREALLAAVSASLGRCCHLHHTEPPCCDPEDCGPCCDRCPTCPTLNTRSTK